MSSRFGMALLVFLLGLGNAAVPAAADHFRGGKIEWCWDPLFPDYRYTGYVTFWIEAIYQRDASQQVGDTVVETFHFGDGTSEPVTLTVTEVKENSTPGSDGWFVAAGTIPNHFYGGPHFYWASLGDCCRIDGTAGPASLNNRNGAPYELSSLVYTDDEYCSPPVGLPRVIWLSGGIGDTFEIPLPVDAGPQDQYGFEVWYCRFADDGEAGGGPNPDGMTIDPATCRITWTPSGDPNKLWTTQVQVEEYLTWGDFLVATAPIDFLLGLDAVKPLCWIENTDPGPPTRIEVLARDLRSGLKSIEILESTNATVQIPPISQGTNAAIEVFGTKIDQTRSSRIRLRVTDLAGNATECDPVLTDEIRSAGKPVSSIHESVPPEEHVVTVYNGDPGLTSLDVEVNGKRFKMTALRAGEERTIDVASAIVPGALSTFVLTSHGKPGGKATVMIWEGQ